MGFMSHRRRGVEIRPEQKWDYISLNDFKTTSCFAPLAYAYLWFSLILSIAVYAVDTFTAVNLLIFSRWASQIPPPPLLPFDVSRWIFSICIILSFLNLAYEHLRARKIMNEGSVAECYLDNLAVRLESIRLGKGRGWRRFLVFAELTKSKKGAEYVALFTYFSFQSWVRVLICSGPRQFVNVLTLYSIYNTKLQINGLDFEASLLTFFDKIGALAVGNYQVALVLAGMIFTLVIWVFSFISLVIAGLFFIFFLWHYIPREDGSLSGYCERKINKRLMTIVSVKINKAMAEDERRRRKAEMKAAKKIGGERPMSMKATLPNVGDDSLPEMPGLDRTDTMSTLPTYTSQPGTPGGYFEMSALDQKRPYPSRTTTQSSEGMYSAGVPLMGAASEMGRSGSPAPSARSMDINNLPPVRTATAGSNRSFGGPQLGRMQSNGSGLGAAYTSSPATYSSEAMPSLPPPARSPANNSPAGYRPPGAPMNSRPQPNGGRSTYDDYSSPSGRPTYDDYSSTNGRPTYDAYTPNNARPTYDDYSGGRSSPAPSTMSSRPGPRPGPGSGPMSPTGPNGYPPARSATNPMPPRGPQPYAPSRNMTAPFAQHQSNGSVGSQRSVPGQPPYQRQQDRGNYDYFDRPGTANSQRTGPPRSDYGAGPSPRY